ncbi:TPA: type 1 fimbrial protein [Aeromonas veronii]|nr:type 1 fimbrial protein [Aeromonas veronii]
MKKNLIAMAVMMNITFLANTAMAADGPASVDLKFQGSIQETTCNIVAEETQKDIDFGMLPASVGKSESQVQNVILSFKGCPTSAKGRVASKVSVTLTGDEGLPGSLKIVPEGGELKDTDVGIQLTDKNGKAIEIGKPMEIADISGDTLKVMLNAKVKGNGKTDAGKGKFSSGAVLNIAYM